MKSQGRIRPYVGSVLAILRLLDACTIGLIWGLCFWATNHPWIEEFVPVLSSGIIIYLLAAEQAGLYRSWRGSNLKEESLAIIQVWGLVVFILLLVFFSTKSSAIYSRQLILTWFVLTPITLITQRSVLRSVLGKLREKNFNIRTVAIVGTGPTAQKLCNSLVTASWSGLRISALFSNTHGSGQHPLKGCSASVIGGVDDLARIHQVQSYDLIYITLPIEEKAVIQSMVAKLADSTASVYVVPDFFVSDLLEHSVVDFNGLPVISVFETPFQGISALIKRAEDLMLCFLILPLIAIPLFLIGAAVKLTSKGPAIYKQRRYGINGSEIVVWKFRTMNVCENDSQFKQANPNDARITRLGKFLRKTSLDELPQFINVLQGRMSVVGPRPHPIGLNEEFRKRIPGYMLRHKLKPGITGWAQVNGWRGETDTITKMEKRIEYDLDYFRRWSVWFDLRIVSLTILKEFGRSRNAF